MQERGLVVKRIVAAILAFRRGAGVDYGFHPWNCLPDEVEVRLLPGPVGGSYHAVVSKEHHGARFAEVHDLMKRGEEFWRERKDNNSGQFSVRVFYSVGDLNRGLPGDASYDGLAYKKTFMLAGKLNANVLAIGQIDRLRVTRKRCGQEFSIWADIGDLDC